MPEKPENLADLGIAEKIDLGKGEIPEQLVEPVKGAVLTRSRTFKKDTVANTAVQVLEEQPTRIAFSIINNSDTDFYVGYDDKVATSGAKRGILVSANGGMMEDEHSKGEVYVICGTGGKAIQVQYTIEKGKVKI